MTALPLALGTAQFGLAYGVTNTRGRLDDRTMRAVLAEARARGVRHLDTAHGYGDSEKRLGAALRDTDFGGWKIITKTPAAPASGIDAAVLRAFAAAWQRSQERLAPLPLHALLVHQADDLLHPRGEALYEWLRERRTRGEVDRIGVSIYEAAQLERLVARYTGEAFDIVQLPSSIADQRLARHPLVSRLRQRGTEIHVRSLFLQGLLLAPALASRAAGPGAQQWLADFHRKLATQALSPAQACMSFFRSVESFDIAVVGVTTPQELAEICDSYVGAPVQAWDAWQAQGPWIDPRTWPAA